MGNWGFFLVGVEDTLEVEGWVKEIQDNCQMVVEEEGVERETLKWTVEKNDLHWIIEKVQQFLWPRNQGHQNPPPHTSP